MRIETPLSDEDVKKLKAGMQIGIDGVIFTARDAAHLKLVELLRNNKKLP